MLISTTDWNGSFNNGTFHSVWNSVSLPGTTGQILLSSVLSVILSELFTFSLYNFESYLRKYSS